METRSDCRFCRCPLHLTLIDLGEMPLANSFPTGDELTATSEPRYPLRVRVCTECFLVQNDHTVPATDIFEQYAYFSSYSDSWVAQCRRFAIMTAARFRLDADSLVVEVASNDGYLLKAFVEHGIPVQGVDPAANVAAVAVANGVPTRVDFFGASIAGDMLAEGQGPADLIVANNVLAHVPDIRDFASGFAALLKPEGVVTFEFPHVLNLLQQLQFDTIYHEHFSYLSLFALEHVLQAVGLRVFDVDTLLSHGGSLRIFACHEGSTQPELLSVQATRNLERQANLGDASGYEGFSPRVEALRAGFVSFVEAQRTSGTSIAGYGAAAKGSTFLNYCNVTEGDLICVFDRSSEKQGRLMPGSHIPIVGPDQIAVVRPQLMLVLPWNLKDEVLGLYGRELGKWGGRLFVAVPKVEVISS